MRVLYTLLLTMCLFVSACVPTEQTQMPAGMGETWAAYTMAAVLTQSAFGTLEAKLTEVSQATPTPEETPTPPDNGATPPTALPTRPAGSSLPCNWALFEKDVTIADGTLVEPGQKFVKTWRFRNIGSCTWNKNYRLVYSSGARMDAASPIPFTLVVAPGDTIDLSVEMTAPKVLGKYTSYWLLESDKGELFGIGPYAKGVFYTQINVGEKSGISSKDIYNLADYYCAAGWYTNKGSLSCPSEVSEENGSISREVSALIEGNIQSGWPTLITIPASGQNGSISGQFPPVQIQQGDRFKARIGCLQGYTKCDVTFQLSYMGGDGLARSLGTWGHTMDAYYDDLDIDLSPAAGMAAQLILTVFNNGSSQDDRAFWVNPRIERP